jgi:hypothetical protein
MKASMLITELQNLMQQHGDLEVVDEADNSVDVEFNNDPADTDDEDGVFIIS